jgi:RNA polymerase sigma-70 factor (sigma-E family)
MREFVQTRSPVLLRSAILMTGNRHAGEDLLQSALEKAWLNWSKVARADHPELYVRRIMLNEYLRGRRRRWQGEIATGEIDERVLIDDLSFQGVEDRAGLQAALAQLPRGQRAVLVLRFFDDLSEAQTADLLGVSPGTVKSQSSKGLTKLRTLLAPEDPKSARSVRSG